MQPNNAGVAVGATIAGVGVGVGVGVGWTTIGLSLLLLQPARAAIRPATRMKRDVCIGISSSVIEPKSR
jgi:hypothetical protein